MTIHSIIPLEVIFAGMEQQTFDYLDVIIEGVSMQVERVGVNQAKIIRLHSCRPVDFLNPAYAPGTIIFYQPSFTT
jgi:hypothetical protein